MLDVDVSRPMRTHTDVAKLVAAVVDAEPHDEADWIEWKTDLDLGEHEGRGALARQVLGMANRDPALAARTAGGCGYVLVGVEPGNCPGVAPIDPAVLEPQLEQYLGDDGPVWQPVWVRQGVTSHVLVVIVDPPVDGDPIHTLRKHFGKYVDGDVFVRRRGATHKATTPDIRRLTARSHGAHDSGRLNVEVFVDNPLSVAPLDTSPEGLEGWVLAERRRLLQPLDDHLAAEAAEEQQDGDRAAAPSDSGLVEGSTLSEMMRQAERVAELSARFTGRVREPEDRAPEEYRDRVERYLEAWAELAPQVAADRHIESGLCRIELAIRNPTDFPFRDVEVDLFIPGDGVYAAEATSYEELPKPPRIWGDRWVHPYGSMFGSQPFPFDATSILHPSVSRIVADPLPSIRIDNSGSARLVFPSVDLPPMSVWDFDGFELIVPPAFAGQPLTATWTARSTAASGVVEGTIDIHVSDDAVDAVDLLGSP